MKVSQEYNLRVANDVHTRGNTQWFYFSVTGGKKGEKVRFNIVNMRKSNSLFNYGMLPSVYSKRRVALEGVHWHHVGEDTCYFKNRFEFTDKRGRRKNHFTLSFVHTFQYSEDTVFFAYSLPYTYTDLQEFLLDIGADPKRRLTCRRKELCRSLSGNIVDILTVTSQASSLKKLEERPVIIVSARVHPGETVASWMMHGAHRIYHRR